jgi:RHS repeat-associated protein
LIKVQYEDPDGTGGQPTPVINYVYTGTGNLKDEIRTSVESPSTQFVTRFEYDNRHRLQKITENYINGTAGPADDEDVITQLVHDAVGNVITVIDPLLRDTNYTYDLLDREIRRVDEDPDAGSALASPITHMAYDALGRMFAERDPNSNITRYAYDARHRQTGRLEPLGVFTQQSYYDDGQLETMIDPEGRTTSYTYDGAGRLSEVRLPGQTTTPIEYDYDTSNNLRFVYDQLDQATQYQYDYRQRVIKEIDPNSDDVEYTYFDDGQIATLKDGNNYVTTWTYDNAGRVATETNPSPLSDPRSYKYDEFNRLVQLTDRRNRVTKFEYDKLDRLTFERWYADPQDQSPDHTITFVYDQAGQLESAYDSFADYDFSYDYLGRPTTITSAVTGTDQVVFTQTFDAVGNRTQLATEIGGVDDFVNNYTFDALNRLTRVIQTDVVGGTSVGDKRVDFNYLRDSQYRLVTRYADLSGAEFVAQSEYSYDATGRLNRLKHRGPKTAIADYGYTYDASNRMLTFTNANQSGESVTYTYDNRGQLLTGDLTGTTNHETYTYDDNGNRNNGFTEGDNNQITNDGTYTYTYDLEGNVDTRTRNSGAEPDGSTYRKFEWDHRNRLISVTDKTSSTGTQTQKVTNTYDAFNRLVKRTFQLTSGGAVTTGYFIHDGNQIIFELESDGDVTHRLLWGAAVDEALADESAGTTYWYLTDHLGTVRDVATYNTTTNITTIANHVAFDSFGKRTSETNSSLGDFDVGFTGKWFDRATGLTWNLNRWYSPVLQRWISEDPIGFAGSDANLYRYVGNEPQSKTDPAGLYAIDPFPLFHRRVNDPQPRNQDWLDKSANWAAGWGDTLSLGITDWIREKTGINDGIDHNSTPYKAGEVTGIGHTVVLGAAGAARKAAQIAARRAAAREAAENAAKEAAEREAAERAARDSAFEQFPGKKGPGRNRITPRPPGGDGGQLPAPPGWVPPHLR